MKMHQLSRFGNKICRYINPNYLFNNHRTLDVLNTIVIRENHGTGSPILDKKESIGLHSKPKINFNEMLSARRLEAQQSILVQVNSEKSFSELHSYCCQFGDVKGGHHFTQDDLHYILVEFSNSTAAQNALSQSVHNADIDGIYVHSPFLWFRAGPKNPSVDGLRLDETQLSIIDGNHICSDAEISDLLKAADNLNDQLLILHRSTCLNDIGIRLRFMAARQIEESLSGMFPQAQVFPFGSSVNGFGKFGCDLDLILRLVDYNRKNDPSQRLVFHSKETLSSGRSQTQRYMENLSDILQLFLPGISHVRRILQARVPIIKYHHEHLDLEIDLTMSNMSGVYMSELFYMFGQIDERVQPLVFAVRKWAQSVGLTNPSPGRWITNFSLTCLVIAYLQQLSQPILPSINTFMQQAKPDDRRVMENNLECTFQRDINSLKFSTLNGMSLHELLVEFFEFYSQIEFGDFAISLNDAKLHTKPDHSAMYIVNPLEPELNVSKNVSIEECERFRIEVRNAAWILESSFSKESQNAPWGILNLFRCGQQTVIRPNMFFKARMVDVSELFSSESLDGSESKPLQYKNNSVKKDVNKIKKKARIDVQTLKADNFKQFRKR